MNVVHIETIKTNPESLDLLHWPVWVTQRRKSISMRSILHRMKEQAITVAKKNSNKFSQFILIRTHYRHYENRIRP